MVRKRCDEVPLRDLRYQVFIVIDISIDNFCIYVFFMVALVLVYFYDAEDVSGDVLVNTSI